MTARFSFLALAFLFSSYAAATPTHIRACNHTSGWVSATIKIDYYCGGDMAEPLGCHLTSAWHNFDPGECRTVTLELKNFTNFGGRYAFQPKYRYHVVGEMGHTWGRDEWGCVKDAGSHFFHSGENGPSTNAAHCRAHGGKWEKKFYNGDSTPNWRLR